MERKDKINIKEYIGLVSGACVLLTILYIYGFSASLDINLFNYFYISDYTNIAIQWLTPVIIFVTLCVLCLKFLITIEPKSSENTNEISQSKLLKKVFSNINNVPILNIFFAFSIGSLYYCIAVTTYSFLKPVPNSKLYYLWGLGGVSLWIVLIFWYLHKEQQRILTWSRTILITLVIFPALIIFAYFKGFSNSAAMKENLFYSNTIELVGDSPKELNGEIAFSLEKYLVFLEYNSQKVLIIPNSRIAMIE